MTDVRSVKLTDAEVGLLCGLHMCACLDEGQRIWRVSKLKGVDGDQSELQLMGNGVRSATLAIKDVAFSSLEPGEVYELVGLVVEEAILRREFSDD